MDRLAFSVLWEMTPDVEVVNITYTKSTIHNRAALRYEDAQDMLDGKPLSEGVVIHSATPEEVTDSLRELMRIAKVLKQRRYVVFCAISYCMKGSEPLCMKLATHAN